MATKTITTTVTIHGAGKDHKPFELFPDGSRKAGHYAPEAYPPGTEVTLDEAEADAILKRFGGEEITAKGAKPVDPKTAAPPKITTDPKTTPPQP